MRITLVLLFLNVFSSWGQEKGSLLYEVFGGSNTYSMGELNTFLTSPENHDMQLFEENPSSQLTFGNHYGANVSYMILPFMDVGIAGSYQYGKVTLYPRIIVPDPMTMLNDTFPGEYLYSVKGYSAQLTTKFYWDRLFKIENERSFGNRIVLGTELRLGFMRASYEQRNYFFNPFETGGGIYNATAFCGNISALLGLRLSHSPILSMVGIKFGYQYAKSGGIKNSIGQHLDDLSNGNHVGLDYSGISTSLYFVLGR